VKVTVTDYVDVARRAAELNCQTPTGLALLPSNFTTAGRAAELCYDPGATAIRAAWKEAGLAETPLEQNGCRPRLFEGAATDRPAQLTVYFSSALVEHEPRAIGTALGALACALSDQRRTPPGTAEVRVEAVVQRPDNCGYACLHYEGDPYDVLVLTRMLREVWSTGALKYDDL